MRAFYFLIMLFFLKMTWALPNVHHHGHGTPPSTDALKVGVDTDGKPLFLCLGRLFNSTQPGKTWAGYNHCNVPYGGKEYIVDQFEVPSRQMFRKSYWSTSGLAITVGRDTNGNPLFLCQAYFRGSKQPGKTWPGYHRCNISYGGQEIITDNYRILTQYEENTHFHGHGEQQPNSYNQHHGHPSQAIQQQCLQGPFGNTACGFNCITSINSVACASSPDQQCVSDNFGHIACGYGCVKTPLKVACASQRGENCIVNSFNEVRCGRGCRMDGFNHIQCN
ncbi:DUF3421 domain-containing protein [Legionella hackeliae]|uniref:Uncharacterized protein n=1 Tax=Legionella hackeliae TaxID=449 RepID=A0A0A8UQQ2_LEGHA|nr:DUF3421 domain-containing protein [Legionella hackeliae]KTD13579.1 hypothetical protein Lhac_0963 [Legionella hackeliae]CEK09427.1 conserved protein of unknown function [Legionella hackeliae]STX49335.1 Protein of uncharacterised function (DUF3421) [Legionella hackeliae]